MILIIFYLWLVAPYFCFQQIEMAFIRHRVECVGHCWFKILLSLMNRLNMFIYCSNHQSIRNVNWRDDSVCPCKSGCLDLKVPKSAVCNHLKYILTVVRQYKEMQRALIILQSSCSRESISQYQIQLTRLSKCYATDVVETMHKRLLAHKALKSIRARKYC